MGLGQLRRIRAGFALFLGAWLAIVFACRLEAAVVFEKNQKSINPKSGFWTLIDEKAQLTPVEALVRLEAISHETLNNPQLRFTTYPRQVWSLIEISNQSDSDELILAQLWQNKNQLYEVQGNNLEAIGRWPFRSDAFRLFIPTGSSRIYLLATQMTLGDIFINLEVSRFSDFYRFALNDSRFLWVSLGIVLVLALINILLGGLSGQRFYLFNSIYLMSLDGFMLIAHGLIKTDSLLLMNGLLVTACLGLAGFNIYFFGLRRGSFAFRLQSVFFGFVVVACLLSWPFRNLILVAYMSGIALIGVSIGKALQDALKKDLSALILLIGWSCLTGSMLIAVFNIAVAARNHMAWSYLSGMVAEAILFSVAFAIRVRQREQDANKLNEHMFNQLSKVFYSHQIDGMRQGLALESTMPVGEGEGFVICFDVISSSKITHPEVRSFLSSVVKQCQEVMLFGYDGVGLRASAYRIKEMGDGFLCSIGYPFASIMDDPADSALSLAFQFEGIFRRQAEIFQIPSPVGCSIAIAYGPLFGFFPLSGTREYDIHGRGIILATRYERIRRKLFPGSQESVLIMDLRSFKQLTAEARLGFREYPLDKQSLSIEDDPTALTLYCLKFADRQSEKIYQEPSAS